MKQGDTMPEGPEVKRIVERLNSTLAGKSISQIDIVDELPIIRGDVSQVEQIFQNLINNAIKYNDKSEGLIQVRYENLKTHHRFSVIDNGIGIDSKYHKKIFDSFKRLHNHKDSSGLGLSIVKRIIQKYGGEISVTSEIGIGSEFTFTIENLTV